MGHIREQIVRINGEIKELEEARSRFQESCPHEKTQEIDYMWRVGATCKVIQCVECDRIVLKDFSSKGTVTKFSPEI